jgi:nitrosocyanin
MKRTTAFLASLVLLLAAAPARAAVRELTLVNIKYQGKVLWLPATLIVKKGETVKLTLVNNVPDDPAVHGFSIPAFGVKADVEREKPLVVEFTADKAGLFETSCHLHPAHLHGQLLVLE